MRQHTTPEQTAKLIELGFEPKQVPATCGWADDENYLIGELIAMLPDIHPLYHDPYCFDISFDTIKWVVGYTYDNGYVEVVSSWELIDALYLMLVKLKEQEVI